MKKGLKIVIYIITFVLVFSISGYIRLQLLGGGPVKVMSTDWNDGIGTVYKNIDYKNDNGNKLDLYIPEGLDKEKDQYLIMYIHGGSFNSGAKEDGDAWCKYYASKGYIAATVDYTLQNHGLDASIGLINEEIENSVIAIKEYLENKGYKVTGMAPCGVSAGGTLAMNLAYNGNSAIPVNFVFQLSAPTYFDPDDWSLLMKVDKLTTKEDFVKMMTGQDLELDKCAEAIDEISPAKIVNEKSVPSLIGYGLHDHCVPLNQKFYLMDAYDKYNVTYDYIEFPKSNHGMYNDLDKTEEFRDMSLEYCQKYFKQ